MSAWEEGDVRFIVKGDPDRPTLLFIPGLSATAEGCYGAVADLLKARWHIVLCELDGHYPGSAPFSTLDNTCAEIEAYVKTHTAGKVYGMIGLSLGGAVAVSLLGRGNLQVAKAVLDAAYCMDMGLLKGLYARVFPMGVCRVRDGKPIPGFLMDFFMGKGNRSMTDMLYPGIDRETLRNACREVYSYQIPEGLRAATAEVAYWRGANEAYPRKICRKLKAYLPKMTERVFAGMGHCQFLHEHPRAYASALEDYMHED